MTDLDKARQAINETDREIARLFEQRMDAVRQVAEYKIKNNLPVEDSSREEELFRRNIQHIENEDNRSYYTSVLKSVVEQSKRLQRDLRKELFVKTVDGGYAVHICRGGLHRVGEFLDLDRKVLVVSDSGVPEEYAMTVASQCTEAVLFVFQQGESSKCLDTYAAMLQTLVDHQFTRTDCVVAVGGGVVGDIAGFVAATYMRGIDFYNIPTTVLSQVDSSIGGKTAVDFGGYKNLVGAFYAPKGVLIDSDVLQTLPLRQISNGMAEIIKMAMTHDAELIEMLETTDQISDDILYRALAIKKQVVEADEREAGLRKVLNFGHTFGHAIESVSDYCHGECVALGMLPMCDETTRERLVALLEKWGLPITYSGDLKKISEAFRHDKKADGDQIEIVYVPQIGTFEMQKISFAELNKRLWEMMRG